jgi:RNase P subunit RPR2
MKSKISKTELTKKIELFFSDIKNKSQKEVKKIKKSAMNQNIPLKEQRKLFCKYCLTPYSGKEKIRINKGIKNVECLNCKKISRWRINSS